MVKFLRTALLVVLTLTAAGPVMALNANIALGELNRATWGDRDGMPNDVFTMAQTADGWLWLGTQSGLYKFDGVRFHRQPLKKSRIYHLHATQNGDLLISYFLGGLSILHADGSLEEIEGSDETFYLAMVRDADGTLWTVGAAGVQRHRNGRWKTVDPMRDHAEPLSDILQDQYGRIWMTGATGVFLLDRERETVERIGDGEGGRLTQSPDGQIWVYDGKHIRAVPMPAVDKPLPRRADFNQSEARGGGQFDRDGNLWAMRCAGLCRLRPEDIPANKIIDPARDATDRLDQHWQLSSTTTNEVLEDREGNIWISTASGLDRFRENKIIAANIPSTEGSFTMAVDGGGQLWVSDFRSGAVWTVAPGVAPLRDRHRDARIVAKGRDGAVLLAGKREIEWLRGGTSSRIALPQNGREPRDLNVYGMVDDGKIVWVVTMETGVIGLVDGKWVPAATLKLPSRVHISAAGNTGQLWLGHPTGMLSLYDNGKVSQFDSSAVGLSSAIFHGPQVVVAGERGIAVMLAGKIELLGPPDVEALRNVTGMATTANGDHWFNGNKGVIHVRKDDWDAALRTPRAPLSFTLLDWQDGYAGRADMLRRHPTAVHAGNGRIWLLGNKVMSLETSTLKPNEARPVTQVLALRSGDKDYALTGNVALPPQSRSFNIEYSAPGLRKPDGMRFQYKLDGVDAQWVDAGARRAAYYTNIGPGRYTFKVRALNEDGIAGVTAAALPIEVAPTTTQTWWFRVLCALALLAAGVALHRYRIRAAMAQAARQVHVRTDERERIARTLHDTFLQSIYALILQVYALVLKLPEGSESRVKLKEILDLANTTIDEGRAQVQQLRSGYDVEQMLKRIGDTMATIYPGTAFDLRIGGQRRKLSVAAQEELSGIGQEAVHNAFQHADGSRVTVEIDYGAHFLTLRVSDDGKGLDGIEAQQRVQDGHWGLVGMRERARRAGGRLDIRSANGTVIECQIPATLAYEAA